MNEDGFTAGRSALLHRLAGIFPVRCTRREAARLEPIDLVDLGGMSELGLGC